MRLLLGLFGVAMGFCVSVGAGEVREVPGFAKAFAAEGVTGTFVLLNVGDGSVRVHDRERAGVRFVPASTFKIANALMGLETGAVRDVEEVLPYGGGPQRIAAWEKDMSLREGIAVSNVPVFQELARRIGRERMATQVAALRYGNGEIGTVVDRFWLDGPLKISALEQVEFLGRLVTRKLPVEEKNVAAVEGITLLEKDGEARLYGKTGWQAPIGWWVGWVRRGDEVFAFALNMEMREMADAPKRISVGKACLREAGVWR